MYWWDVINSMRNQWEADRQKRDSGDTKGGPKKRPKGGARKKPTKQSQRGKAHSG